MCISLGPQKAKSNRTESKVKDITGMADGLSVTKDWPWAVCGYRKWNGGLARKSLLPRVPSLGVAQITTACMNNPVRTK